LPERVEETLLVVVPFTDRGTEFRPGDRVPIRHRRMRQVAAKHPEFFRMEYETEELDLQWLADLEVGFERKYEAAVHAREEEKARRKRALRQELETQDIPDHELERRFKRQEAERKEREQEAKEEREREAVERNIALTGGGFHF
jgi:hypothetical protein